MRAKRSGRYEESYQSYPSDEAVRSIEGGLSLVGVIGNDHRAGFVVVGRRLAVGSHEDIVRDFGPLDEASF